MDKFSRIRFAKTRFSFVAGCAFTFIKKNKTCGTKLNSACCRFTIAVKAVLNLSYGTENNFNFVRDIYTGRELV